MEVSLGYYSLVAFQVFGNMEARDGDMAFAAASLPSSEKCFVLSITNFSMSCSLKGKGHHAQQLDSCYCILVITPNKENAIVQW